MSLFMLICREICFVAIYAVLAQNLFCRDLRTFVWRKIYSEIVLVEKKGQISGMFFTKYKCLKIFLLKSHGMCLDNLAHLGEGGGLSLTGNAHLK